MGFNFKFIVITKFLLIVNLGIWGIMSNNSNNEEEKRVGKIISKLNYEFFEMNRMTEWQNNYERTIEYIKEHEGFAGGKPYVCPGGYPTIGYGHVIVAGEKFTKLSENQADSLLRIDFNKALKLVDKTINITGSRKLAVAHFVFTRGIGTFIKSPLRKLIEQGKSIDEEIVKWCYYKNSDGKKIRSQHAFKIREWERDMYNMNL